jgi:hypothetical protein
MDKLREKVTERGWRQKHISRSVSGRGYDLVSVMSLMLAALMAIRKSCNG